jgi:hypothetical protein
MQETWSDTRLSSSPRIPAVEASNQKLGPGLLESHMSNAIDLFVVKPSCTSARNTSFSSHPFVALTQDAKVLQHKCPDTKIAKACL